MQAFLVLDFSIYIMRNALMVEKYLSREVMAYWNEMSVLEKKIQLVCTII